MLTLLIAPTLLIASTTLVIVMPGAPNAINLAHGEYTLDYCLTNIYSVHDHVYMGSPIKFSCASSNIDSLGSCGREALFSKDEKGYKDWWMSDVWTDLVVILNKMVYLLPIMMANLTPIYLHILF